jgi:hypothetical protein
MSQGPETGPQVDKSLSPLGWHSINVDDVLQKQYQFVF